MPAVEYVAQWHRVWDGYFVWRRRRTMAEKVALCFGMALLTGLAAQVRLPLGSTPVPVTGQVFAVLLSGVVLGGGWAGLSMLIYATLGAAGLPWFTGWQAGLTGATAGFIIGFTPAALLVGWLSEGRLWRRGIGSQVALMLLGVAVLYATGAAWFACVFGTGVQATLALAVAPFVLIDFAKAIAVALLTSTMAGTAVKSEK